MRDRPLLISRVAGIGIAGTHCCFEKPLLGRGRIGKSGGTTGGGIYRVRHKIAITSIRLKNTKSLSFGHYVGKDVCFLVLKYFEEPSLRVIPSQLLSGFAIYIAGKHSYVGAEAPVVTEAQLVRDGFTLALFQPYLTAGGQ